MMIRSAAGKVAWMARATTTVVGLAIMLALVFGFATTALSATGGSFILGKANGATTVSKLTASIAGPALTLVNQSTEAAATALNISVASGKPPLKVNAAAGTATNLSADELDGKDSAHFLPADTYTSRAPVTSGINTGGENGIRYAEWQCDQGDELLSGGYRWTVNATSLAVVGSWPTENTWSVEWANTSNANEPYQMQLYVKCADTAAPAHG